MRSDDQIMGAASPPRSSRMGDEPSVMDSGRLGVLQDLDGAGDSSQSTRARSGTLRRLCQLNTRSILSHSNGGDSQLVIIKGSTIKDPRS